jgi:hypothetical protein
MLAIVVAAACGSAQPRSAEVPPKCALGRDGFCTDGRWDAIRERGSWVCKTAWEGYAMVEPMFASACRSRWPNVSGASLVIDDSAIYRRHSAGPTPDGGAVQPAVAADGAAPHR